MPHSEGRSVPMEVVGLGLCRTGTQSLSDALTALGYGTTYHMQEVIKENHLDFWVEKINNLTSSKGAKMPTTDELEKYMGDYRTVCDAPPALFPIQLLDAYPDAKLVMTTRSCESWMKSVQTSLLKVFGTAARTGTNEMAPMGDAFQALWDGDFMANGEAFFHEHHRKVREEVAKRGREMLEFNVADPDSWQKLCDFLGKESPAGITSFPNRDFFRAMNAKFQAVDPSKGADGQAEVLEQVRRDMQDEREAEKKREASAI